MFCWSPGPHAALEEVEERIHDAGGSATIAPLDLTEGKSIGKLAVAVAERWEGSTCSFSTRPCSAR